MLSIILVNTSLTIELANGGVNGGVIEFLTLPEGRRGLIVVVGAINMLLGSVLQCTAKDRHACSMFFIKTLFTTKLNIIFGIVKINSIKIIQWDFFDFFYYILSLTA